MALGGTALTLVSRLMGEECLWDSWQSFSNILTLKLSISDNDCQWHFIWMTTVIEQLRPSGFRRLKSVDLSLILPVISSGLLLSWTQTVPRHVKPTCGPSLVYCVPLHTPHPHQTEAGFFLGNWELGVCVKCWYLRTPSQSYRTLKIKLSKDYFTLGSPTEDKLGKQKDQSQQRSVELAIVIGLRFDSFLWL